MSRDPVGVEGCPLFEGVRPPWSTQDVRPPVARASDPPASHEAAIRALPNARDQEKWIVGVLLGFGAMGGTAKEIAAVLPWGEKGDVIVSRRLSGLRDAGYLITYSGRPEKGRGHLVPALERDGCHVHVAAQDGVAVGTPPELLEQGKAA